MICKINKFDCTTKNAIITLDPDIAGTGVLLAFGISTLSTVLIAVALYLLREYATIKSNRLREREQHEAQQRAASGQTYVERRTPKQHRADMPTHSTLRSLKRWISSLEEVLLPLSDQQLITTIAIQVTAYVQFCTIDSQHFIIVTSLAQISTASHILSLTSLRSRFAKSSARRRTRLVAVGLNNIMLIISVCLGNLAGLRIPAPLCYFHLHRNVAVDLAHLFLSSFSLIAVFMALSGIYFLYFLHHSLAHWWQVVPLYACVFEMIWGFSGIISGRSDFNDGDIHVQVVQGDKSSNWGFGQILANIFLLLPVMIAIESFTEATPEEEVSGPSEDFSSTVFDTEDIDLPPPAALHKSASLEVELNIFDKPPDGSRHRRSDTESMIEGCNPGPSRATSDRYLVTGVQKSNQRIVRRSTPEKLLTESGFL